MHVEIKSAERGTQVHVESTGQHWWLWVLLLISIASLAVVTPFTFLGNASGHDFEFHLASWMEIAHQWRLGIVYPHWAALANWGFGEARFIFYPPASWILGAALSFVFPWPMVPAAFIWVALLAAGACMFALAREWLAPEDAIAAALIFALNPYHLLIIYWRSDFAELLASAVIPLTVLFAMRMAGEPRRALTGLAIITAAIWLSNAPAAVVTTYAIGLILLVVAVQERSAKPLIYGGAGLALGLALAAFYILPAAYEQPWVNIAEVLSQGLTFPENFLFTRTADPEHTRFNFVASWVAVEVAIAAIAAIAALLATKGLRQNRRTWWILMVLAVISVLLMLPITSLLWSYAPKLRYVQFPWRWLLVLDVPFAIGVAAATSRLRGTWKQVCRVTVLVALAATGFLLTRSNWWDAGGVSDFYRQHFQTAAGYFGTDEYGPRGSDHYNLPEHAPKVGIRDGRGTGARVQVLQWGPADMDFTLRASAPVTAAPRVLNYPAWRVLVNGEAVRAISDPDTGQMLLPLGSEISRVRIQWVSTPDHLWGKAISVLAAVTLLLVLVIGSRRRTVLPSQPSR